LCALIVDAVLIQQFARAPREPLVGFAFGLASSKSRAIGIGLPGLLFAIAALPETVQIDQLPHHCPSCSTIGGSRHFVKERELRKPEMRTGWLDGHCNEVPIKRPLIASNIMIRSAKTNIFVLYHSAA